MTSPRPLNAAAIVVVIVLCVSWGLNQVAVKVALAGIPPFTQAAIRSAGAAVLVLIWARLRGIPLRERDGTLGPGLLAGLLFALEFILVYRGLVWTSASRSVLFLYTAPFFVVLGARWLIPADRFTVLQWVGLALSFVGVLVAFGVPEPAADSRQMAGDLMLFGAAAIWGATTLVIKATALNRVSAEKTMLYQLVVSAPLLAAVAMLLGERVEAMPSPDVLWALAYQTVWVVGITYIVWFAFILRYSASRLSVFTFLTPLFGVAAGHLLLDEPLTPAFAAAAGLVAAGLVLVNWRR
jgi:drug/metabolite transporter (DMT)-like permease